MSVTTSALISKPVAPTAIAVSERLDRLELTMAQGERLALPAPRLRANCKCAHCLRARIDGVFPATFDGIAITSVTPVGAYAVNIGFSDGHARGIYPWAYLLQLTAA
ncbi:MAG TPA: gamma-butyrobetaine hydroxylase-like domain-containing protein [Rhodopseudomonas sp.]|uniref:gamma-butyrobetaine hydroxylase-like domain-containing protein n=1 Tax=Rhodopseudomonas sp. TaxID=1078 RepID=UPI002ED7F516